MPLFDMCKHCFIKPNPVQHTSATAFMLSIKSMGNMQKVKMVLWIATHFDVINNQQTNDNPNAI